MEENYESYKKKKFKKRIILTFISIFVLLNLYVVYTPFKRIYLVQHAYPQAQKWEFMATVVRVYGYFIAKYTPLDERDWIIKQFIALDHKLLDKAAQYIPDDDLEKHLKIWYLYESYQAWNNGNSPFLYKKAYTLKETKNILEDLWIQLDFLMTMQTQGLFYKVEKFKIWVSLSYVYIANISVYWQIDENNLDYTTYINDRKNLERLIKIYDYNEYIFQYYKEHFPKVYKAYSDKGFNIPAKHSLAKDIIPYLIKNKNQYIKGDFCNLQTNQYLKGYIDSRNELLEMRNDPNENIESLERLIGDYREKLINQTCKNINLIKGIQYEYNN